MASGDRMVVQRGPWADEQAVGAIAKDKIVLDDSGDNTAIEDRSEHFVVGPRGAFV
ncbi:hypothetical protein Dimus_018176, partial [Dionaea muscipula]